MKAWIAAARPRTLPLALASIILGSFLAAAAGRFSWLTFWLAVLTTTLLQVLSNFANDYGDAVSGKDTPDRVGPRRAVATGDLTRSAMRRAMIMTSLLALGSGIWLLAVTTRAGGAWLFWVFLGLGLLCIGAAIAYTNGKRPYGYAGYGDVAVLLFFGWVGVLGTFFLHTLFLTPLLLLPASAVGLFATGVLNINNVRDMATDARTGKQSIPVRLGRVGAVRYHWALLTGGMGSALAYTLLTTPTHFATYLYILSFPLFILNGNAVATHQNPADLNPRLGQLALSTLLFVVLFGVGVLI